MSVPTSKKLEGAALAPLVYWLLVICGLAGITVLRFGSYGAFVTSDDVFALWAGSVVGIGLGQLTSFFRVRAWVPAVLAMFGFWFVLPIAFLVLDGIFGATAQTFLLAFLPASICGYLSLSERGALVAFWYPAVLWMVVILDGPVPGVLDGKFALPFVVGLAALFVVYLRARETRRVAIWKAHANERLAEAKPRTVLRASPLRAASQHVWSAMVGASALVMTAWIAPHLWETAKDPWRAPSAAAHAYPQPRAYAAAAGVRCCPVDGKQREHVKEYFPLKNGRDVDDDSGLTGACQVCPSANPFAGSAEVGTWHYVGSPGSGLSGTVGDNSLASWGDAYGSYGSYGASAPSTSVTTPPTTPATYDPLTYDPVATPPPVTPIAPAAVTPPPPPPVEPAKPASPATAPPLPDAPAPPAAAKTSASLAAPPAATSATSITLPAPWKSSLGLCTLAFAFILFSRASRRALTLRHLARPFWNESLDQRISNHWQRMLIGLRDAGLQPARDEQPQAFARRIGIDGMSTCATILERVRHGVRVDADDLTTMAAAADGVFRAARERAGTAGRATAWLRAPMV